MSRRKGFVVEVGDKFLTSEEDSSGRPKLTRLLMKAAVYPTPAAAMAAQDRLSGDQAQCTRISRR